MDKLSSSTVELKLQTFFKQPLSFFSESGGGTSREQRNTKIKEWFKENFNKYANKNGEISKHKFLSAVKALEVQTGKGPLLFNFFFLFSDARIS